MGEASSAVWAAVGGSVIGLLGGMVGCYAAIRNTNGSRERALMIRASMAVFLGVSLFLAALFLIPASYRFLLWIPYPFLLLWGIRTINRKQAEIRQQEAKGA